MNTEKLVTIMVSHHYSHSPEKVFDSWLNPEIARRFLFATETGEIIRCHIDSKVGGKFLITDRRNGQDVEHLGEFLEIDRPYRLKFTFGVPIYSSVPGLVTIDIRADETGCELLLTTEVFAEWLDRTRDGWIKILKTLHAVIDSREHSICLSRWINHPAAKVWRALTDPEIHARWWAAGDVKAEVGHRFTLDMGPWGKQPCEGLAVEHERLLRYSFAPGTLDTTITWRLEPENEGTRLHLEHAGFDPDSPLAKRAFEGMGRGWPGLLERIAPAIESEGSN